MHANVEIPLHIYWNGQNPEHWQLQMLVRMWSNRKSHLLLVEIQNGIAALENSLVVSYNTQRSLTVWSSSYTQFTQRSWKLMSTQMLIAVLFIITETWKQPRCLSVGEWVNCSTCRQWVLFSTKKNEPSSHEETWRKLKCIIILSERSQSEKATCCMIPTAVYDIVEKAKLWRQ